MLKKVKILCTWKKDNELIILDKNGYKISDYVAAYKHKGYYRLIDIQTGMMLEDPTNSHAKFKLTTLQELEDHAEEIKAYDLIVRDMKGYNKYVEAFNELRNK